MPKKTLTIRDFTKGLNTDSSPRDIEDNALARSEGASIERPGVLRPLGKANSQSGEGLYYQYSDNGNSVGTTGFQDPGHGLYAFSYTYNHGVNAQITKAYSNHNVNSSITYVELNKTIGTGNSQINVQAGDVVRIYGKTANTELNNRYYNVRSASGSQVYLRRIIDGENKEFSLNDEGGVRVAQTIYNTGGYITSTMSSASTGDETSIGTASADSSYNGVDLFSFGDYVIIGQEIMKVVAMDASAKTITFKRGELNSTVSSHSSSSKIMIYTHGPTHSGNGGIEQITNQTDRDFSGSGNWSGFNATSATVTGGKLVVVTNGSDSNAGARLGYAHIDGPNGDKAFEAKRRYRIKVKLTGVTNYAGAQFYAKLGGRDSMYYFKPVTKHIDEWHDGTITSSEVEYYTDVTPINSTDPLDILVSYDYNHQEVTFNIDDVSVKEIDSIGENINDGYLEIVPQRNFTKYIACQNAETIDLYSSDTLNEVASGWSNRIVDLKDDFKGSILKESIGLDTLGSNFETLSTKGIMPHFFFGENALRVSPSNKIGLDDTNYSPRWYGHVKRDKLFGADNDVNYTNEWYKDTIAPKMPNASGASSLEETIRYGLNITNDYSKNNSQNTPWGQNWFTEHYLKSHSDKEYAPIAIMQDIDFWEDEEDAAEDMNRYTEVENDDEFYYEISQGSLNRSVSSFNRIKRDTSKHDGEERYRIRRSLYQRIKSLKTNVKEDVTVTNGTDYITIPVNDNSKFKEGYMYLFQKDDSTNILMIAKFVETDGDDGAKFLRFQEGTNSIPGGDADLNSDTKIYEVRTYRLTKPSASGDLCLNNSGGGFNGAYTSAVTANTLENNSAFGYGLVRWIGLTSHNNCNLSLNRKVTTLTYDANETPGTPGISITRAEVSGYVATFTTSNAHGFSNGYRVKIEGFDSGSNTDNYNWNPSPDGEEHEHRISNVTDTTFDIDSTGNDSSNHNFNGNSTVTDRGTCTESRRGLPAIVTTKDASLDNTNWIYHNYTKEDENKYFQSRNPARDLIMPGRDYYVTFSVRNFFNVNNGVIRVTVGQTLSELDEDNTDEYYDIKSNCDKMTVKIKAPDTITEVNACAGVNFQIKGNLSVARSGVDKKGAVGTSNITNNDTYNSRRTLLGDISLYSKDRRWNSTVSAYAWPKTSLAFGWYWTWGIDGDSWGLNSSSYDFYVTYLYDGGSTPQESAPRFLRSKKNLTETGGLRVSVSSCYSSTGDVYDMFNRRITGARLYFKATDSVESDKLQALLDVDFIKGVRKSNNANYVPWEEDYSGQWEKQVPKVSPGYGDYEIEGDYTYESDMKMGPYKQVKPQNVAAHEHGYFRFDSPPSVLDYETLNASLPFEKGNFYAQYKTSTLLKGKCYIGNFSILPNGLTSQSNYQSFEYFPNAIIASEEGCYDKFPFETKYINMPIENDDSPVVKLESYNDNLIVHKELSTYIISFKDENKPSLVASIKTSGIMWMSQSIATSVGIFWVNKFGCYYFNGEKVSDLTIGKISKSQIGWPNNESNLYYWDINPGPKEIPSIAFDEIDGQLLIAKNCRQGGDSSSNSSVWIYNLKSKSWTSDRTGTSHGKDLKFLAPITHNQGYRTNFIPEATNKIIFLDNRVPNGTEYSFVKWSKDLFTKRNNNGVVIEADNRPLELLTKEYDFGNPHQLKRIYQVFVTYRMTSTVIDSGGGGGLDPDIDIDIEYGTDGGSVDNPFQKSANNNFENSFSNTDGEWKIATLVPSSSIECYTFQLFISTGTYKAPYDFEINDITFVYRQKNIRTSVKE